jgi:hypothetical protein
LRGSSCVALRNHDQVEVRGRLPAGQIVAASTRAHDRSIAVI